jgi:hypothetical protein
MTALSPQKFSPSQTALTLAQKLSPRCQVIEYKQGELEYIDLSREDLFRLVTAFKFTHEDITSHFSGNKRDYIPTESDVDQISTFVVDVYIHSAHTTLTIQTEKMDDTYHLTIIPDIDLDPQTLSDYLSALTAEL